MKLPMVSWLVPALLLGFAPAVPVCAAEGGHFIDPAGLDIRQILPEPPAADSLAGRADLEAVRAMQALRTPADMAWARRIMDFSAFDYADVLGPWFTPQNLPITAEFLKAVTADSELTSDRVKLIYTRPRPPLVDPALQPCVKLPKTSSYPSSHSTRAFLWAAILGEMFPDQREALLAWAHRAAWGRIIGGVHYPSDDVGGQLLAKAIMAELAKNPAFRAALERARAEAEPFHLKQAA
jgi:acid phosphatase (class A)